MVIKDFRHFRRLLDPYLGVLVAVICGIYFVTAKSPAPETFFVFIVIVFVPNASLAFNYFGFETNSGFDRYALLPMRGKEIIFAKNLAFVAVVGVQLLPMLLLAGWRLGLSAVAGGIFLAVLLSLAYLSWGNLVSVAHPFKMQPFRFSSGGSPVDAIFGLIFGSLPGIVVIYFLRSNGDNTTWQPGSLLPVYGVIYFVSLAWSGKRFERNKDRLKLFRQER